MSIFLYINDQNDYYDYFITDTYDTSEVNLRPNQKA